MNEKTKNRLKGTILLVIISAVAYSYWFLVEVPFHWFVGYDTKTETKTERVMIGNQSWNPYYMVVDFAAWDGLEMFTKAAPWQVLWSRNGLGYSSIPSKWSSTVPVSWEIPNAWSTEYEVAWAVNSGKIIPPDGYLYRNDSTLFKWLVSYVGKENFFVQTNVVDSNGHLLYREQEFNKYEVKLIFFDMPIYEYRNTTTTTKYEVYADHPYLVLNPILKYSGYGLMIGVAFIIINRLLFRVEKKKGVV